MAMMLVICLVLICIHGNQVLSDRLGIGFISKVFQNVL